MKPYYEHAGITIYHGDCIEVLPLLCSRNIKAILTDPPYGTQELGGGYGRRQLHSADGRSGRRIVNDSDLSAIRGAAPYCFRLLCSNSWLVCFCASRRMIETAAVWKDAGFGYYGEFIWDKLAPGLGYTIRYVHESALVFMKGKAEKKGAPVMSMFRGPSGRVDTQLRHPHEKPVPILRGMLALSEGLVLDPFMGSGTTLQAAKQLGRRAIGIEINEKYCEIAAYGIEHSRVAVRKPSFDPLFTL